MYGRRGSRVRLIVSNASRVNPNASHDSMNPTYRDSLREIIDLWAFASTRDEVEAVIQNEFYMFFGDVRETCISPICHDLRLIIQEHLLSDEQKEAFTSHWMSYWRGKRMMCNMVIGPLSIMVSCIASDIILVTLSDLMQCQSWNSDKD